VVLAFYPGNDVKNNSSTLEDKLKPEYTTGGALQRVIGVRRASDCMGGVRCWRVPQPITTFGSR
jgi:hypothetical protein